MLTDNKKRPHPDPVDTQGPLKYCYGTPTTTDTTTTIDSQPNTQQRCESCEDGSKKE
jgi:hypothetical protein